MCVVSLQPVEKTSRITTCKYCSGIPKYEALEEIPSKKGIKYLFWNPLAIKLDQLISKKSRYANISKVEIPFLTSSGCQIGRVDISRP